MAYASGTCGDNVTWELSDDGVLTLSGSGATYGYIDTLEKPWSEPYVKAIVVGNGITEIGEAIFRNCHALTSVSLPSSLTKIGASAFSGCDSLTSLSVPSGVQYIGDSAFWGCGFTNFVWPASIPNILHSTFYYCESLTAVTIPSGVKTIGVNAFQKCSMLSSVILPNTLEAIDSGAFKDCAITSIVIPASVTFCHRSAFDCSVFTGFVVENGNTSYSAVEGVLFNADKTELLRYPIAKTASSYTVPDGVITIGAYSFEGVLYLLKVIFADTVKEVDACAFDGVQLTEVTLSQSLEVISRSAFEDTQIRVIALPESLITIDASAFAGTAITSVTIPQNVESLSTNAFPVKTMVSYTVDAENKHYSSQDGVLFNADMTELRIYPACKTGEEYTVPDGVTTITATAFSYVSYLQKVILPKSVATISGSAFGGTSSGHIVTLELYGKTPPAVISSALAVLTSIIVPYGTGDKYKAAEGWKDYAAIIVEAENKKFPLRQFILGLLSELTAGSAKEPIAYLYNGVRLPKLPEWDRGVYPYAVIVVLSNGTYRLLCTAEQVTHVYSEFILISNTTANYTFISYDLVDGEWEQVNKGAMVPAIWTNHNLYYHETEEEAGELYMAASEPIPVYE